MMRSQKYAEVSFSPAATCSSILRTTRGRSPIPPSTSILSSLLTARLNTARRLPALQTQDIPLCLTLRGVFFKARIFLCSMLFPPVSPYTSVFLQRTHGSATGFRQYVSYLLRCISYFYRSPIIIPQTRRFLSHASVRLLTSTNFFLKHMMHDGNRAVASVLSAAARLANGGPHCHES